MSTANAVLSALGAYNLESKGGGQYQFNAPWRPGADSMTCSLIIEDDEHGAFKDFHANSTNPGGSLYELAEHLGIATPKKNGRAQAENTKRVYRDLDEYARVHGLDDGEPFRAHGWRDDTIDGRPSLVFKTANGERVRFIDGGEPRYKAVKKPYKNCWYGLKRAIILSGETGLPLVFVNGEASTIVAQHFGIPACCITGGEKASIHKDFLPELLEGYSGKIVVALDCDDAGRAAAAGIVKQLRAAGRDAVNIDLGLTDGGDFADLCKLNGQNTAARYLELIAAPPAPEPEGTPPDTGDPAISPLEAARSLAQSTRELTNLLKMSDKPVGDVLAESGAQIMAQLERIQQASDPVPMVSSADVLPELHNMAAVGLPTGLRSIDAITGGLPYGNIAYIYGATNMGKSAICQTIAGNLENAGCKILYITTETIPVNFMRGVIARIAHLHKNDVRANNLKDEHEYKRMQSAKLAMAENGSLWINAIQPPLEAIKQRILKAADEGVNVVIVDSVSRLVDGSNREMVGLANNMLQALARKTGLPFLVTTQVSREIEGRAHKIPRLSDAYGGAVIEHNAEVVMALYRHEYYVKRKLADEDNETFPPNTACLVMQKVKEPLIDGVEGGFVTIAYKQGIGFFDLERLHVNMASSADEPDALPKRQILIDETVSRRK
jgi:replicative DNA helicase